jgi:hypothetical protein
MVHLTVLIMYFTRTEVTGRCEELCWLLGCLHICVLFAQSYSTEDEAEKFRVKLLLQVEREKRRRQRDSVRNTDPEKRKQLQVRITDCSFFYI